MATDAERIAELERENQRLRIALEQRAHIAVGLAHMPRWWPGLAEWAREEEDRRLRREAQHDHEGAPPMADDHPPTVRFGTARSVRGGFVAQVSARDIVNLDALITIAEARR